MGALHPPLHPSRENLAPHQHTLFNAQHPTRTATMSAPTASLTFPEGHPLKNIDLSVGVFINNEWSAGEGGKTIEVRAPAFDKVWGEHTPGSERGRLLMKLADLFEEHAETLASIEALDNGKAFGIAKNFDVMAAAGCLRFYGGLAGKNDGKTIEVNESKFAFTRHEPIGVVGLLTGYGNVVGAAISPHMRIMKVAFTGS